MPLQERRGNCFHSSFVFPSGYAAYTFDPSGSSVSAKRRYQKEVKTQVAGRKKTRVRGKKKTLVDTSALLGG
jgi:hypothetical protein